MLTLGIQDKKKVEDLYEKIRSFILSNKGKPKYSYDKHQHHLQEESFHPGISENVYNEEGSFEFENTDGKTIYVRIHRSHPHQHNSWSGLSLTPCLLAQIYAVNSDEKELLWSLNVSTGTLRWSAELTSLEIPKEVLNLESSTSLNDIQNEIHLEDDKSLVDELTEAYKRYCLATTKKETTLTEKDKKIKEAIKKVIEEVTQEITSNYKDIIDKCDSEINATKTEVEQYDSLITKYSTFDKDLIGEAIAYVLSVLNCKDYKYNKVESTYPITCYDPFDDPYFSDTTEFVNIVVDSSKYLKHYYNDEPDKSAIDKLVKSGDAIHLININDPYPMYFKKPEKSIAFLTSKNGEISFNVELDSFEYIKDFIMELVQYRFQRKLNKLTKDDINICIEEFIKKSRKIEIQNRILVLKKELDTLNSKLES